MGLGTAIKNTASSIVSNISADDVKGVAINAGKRAVQGAVVGGATGAAANAIQGEDVWEGAGKGAKRGAVGGALYGAYEGGKRLADSPSLSSSEPGLGQERRDVSSDVVTPEVTQRLPAPADLPPSPKPSMPSAPVPTVPTGPTPIAPPSAPVLPDSPKPQLPTSPAAPTPAVAPVRSGEGFSMRKETPPDVQGAKNLSLRDGPQFKKRVPASQSAGNQQAPSPGPTKAQSVQTLERQVEPTRHAQNITNYKQTNLFG